MRVSLQVTKGPLAGRNFDFEGHDVFLVGRSPNAHCRLPENDPYFSRIHFLIEVNPPKLKLMDMGSLNGTHVNGVRVRDPIQLHDGDEIKAGHTHLMVRVVREAGVEPENFSDDAMATKADFGLQPVPPGGLSALSNPSSSGQIVPLDGDELSDSSGSGLSNVLPGLMGPPRIPGYEILKPLGHGNMGMVHLARSAKFGEVAIKTILPNEIENPITVQRFVREAEVLQQFDHPNVVRFYETGAVGPMLYFAMEYVRGTDVAKVLKEKPRFELRTAIRLVIQVLDALAHAHSKGMVHRDIKPANVLLAELPDGKRQVKLADFGLARVYRASQLSGVTMHGDLGGTPAYMPPEQITNYREVMPAADQYSSAAMLYHMLTGNYIFDLPPMPAGLLTIMTKEPIKLRERRPELPVDLEVVIHRALAKKPQERYSDVASFRQALVPFGR